MNLEESLGRALEEIEVLQAIYEQDLVVKSPSALRHAQSLIAEKNLNSTETTTTIPQLDLELSLDHAKMQFSLVPGYPEERPLRVAVIFIKGLSRAARQELSAVLTTKAEALVGGEAVLQVIQELQDIVPDIKEKYDTKLENKKMEEIVEEHSGFGRRWIWCHHIVDKGRLKSIVQEARDLSLGGYLKPGYPGIVVVEGIASACHDFIIWIKGNKSRPGGFGRNWGHHVKGQVDFVLESQRHLPRSFEQVEPDMAVFGACCKDCGLELEFLEYVMQHGP